MPRFSVKTLIASFTLIAIGVWMVWIVPHYEQQGGNLVVCSLLWFGGGAIAGTGVFSMFNRPWLGAILGIAAVGLLFYLITIELVAW